MISPAMALVLGSAATIDSSGFGRRRAMEIAIIGGGIVGLGLALNLQQPGVTCRGDGTGDRPFGNLDDFISQEELRALSDRYKRIAGYSIEDLAATAPPSAA